jgi:hypothetical protein
MITLIDAEKIFDKIEYPLKIICLKILGIERSQVHIIKVLYGKSIANII